MKNIMKLNINDNNYYKQNEIVNYYIKYNGIETEKKLDKLHKLTETYDNYQEIEDFIYDNFELISMDERTFYI